MEKPNAERKPRQTARNAIEKRGAGTGGEELRPQVEALTYTPLYQRILNGFQVRVGGWFFWLNAYGFGFGRYGTFATPQLNVYRLGWRIKVVR